MSVQCEEQHECNIAGPDLRMNKPEMHDNNLVAGEISVWYAVLPSSHHNLFVGRDMRLGTGPGKTHSRVPGERMD